MTAEKIRGICVNAGKVSEQTFDEARRRYRLMGGGLDTAVFELGLMTEEDLMVELAKSIGMPAWSEYFALFLDAETVHVLSAEQSRMFGAICGFVEKDSVAVLVKDVLAPEVRKSIERAFNKSLKLYLCSEMRFEVIFSRVYGKVLSPRFVALCRSYALDEQCSALGDVDGADVVDAEDELCIPVTWESSMLEGWGSELPQRASESDSRTVAELSRLKSAFEQLTTLEDLVCILGKYAQNHSSAQWWGEYAQRHLRILSIEFSTGLLHKGQSVEYGVEPGGELVSVCSGESYFWGGAFSEEFEHLYEALGHERPQTLLILPIIRSGDTPFLWFWENPAPADAQYIESIFEVLGCFSKRMDALKIPRDASQPSTGLSFKSSLFSTTKESGFDLRAYQTKQEDSSHSLQDTLVPGLTIGLHARKAKTFPHLGAR